jgi:N-acetylmuramoyl-L-alanine amidase
MELRKDFISNKSKKWTNRKLDYQYITIHNNGNPKSTAKNERAYLENPINTSETGYHIVIDGKEAIQVAPLDMIMYHAGEQKGNKTSIGIEICESGDYNQTILNAIDIVSQLLKSKGWKSDRLRQHFDWSKKNCPRLIRSGYMGWTWDKFKSEIDKRLSDEPIGAKPTKSPLQILQEKSIITSVSEWTSWLAEEYIDKELCHALMKNFYLYKSGRNNLNKAIDYIYSQKIISDINYWTNDELKESKYMKIVIERMVKEIK